MLQVEMLFVLLIIDCNNRLFDKYDGGKWTLMDNILM